MDQEIFYMADSIKVVAKSKKDHTCFGCGLIIPVNSIYASFPVKKKGSFKTLHLCLPCLFCWQMQDQERKKNGLTELQFSEIKIPNCLRKLRREFCADMIGTIKKYNLCSLQDNSGEKEKTIIVTNAEIGRRILHLRSTKYPVEKFREGETLHLRAGVRGKRRTVTVQMIRQTTGKGIGLRGKFTGLLVKDKEE